MQGSWLFTRGPSSVRLVREDNVGYVHLSVYGPEIEVATYDFANPGDCRRRQAEIELTILAAGYQLAQASSERRREQRIWHGADRRRAERMISSDVSI
jgi:hypothetical protein